MKAEIVGTFHIGIWPTDDDGDDDEDRNHGPNFSTPTVITKTMMDKTKIADRLTASDEDLLSLPERVRELVTHRREQFS